MIARRNWAAVLLIGCAVAAAEDKDKPATKHKLVKAIIDVKFVYEEKNPPALVITARGMVPTGGWTDVKLEPKKDEKPPADGVYEFNLSAVPPEGIATQALQEVKAAYRWEKPPAELKGLKISGVGEGAKTVRFDDKKK